MARFILVRHGQTEWNRVERFRGRADVPLNETGLAQAEATAWRIADEWRPVAVYSSPLRRATVTARAIASRLGLPVLPVDGVIDIDYGEWQGLTPDEARSRWPKILAAWYEAPQTVQVPGGESLAELRQRTMTAIYDLANRHGEETIAVVSHTVVNRVILLGILGLGNERFWRLGQDNCAINVFETAVSDFKLLSLNDVCHLRALP